ncbi:hypothetical protein MRX96_014193 [Rhipicephalus microplus]
MPRSLFQIPNAATVDWMDDSRPLQRRLSSDTTRSENIVGRGCTWEFMPHQPPSRDSAGRTLSFHANEPGTNAPSPPYSQPRNDICDALWRLFRGVVCQLREHQMPQAREVSSGKHWRVKSRAGSTITEPSSHVNYLDGNALLLHYLSVHERDDECPVMVQLVSTA